MNKLLQIALPFLLLSCNAGKKINSQFNPADFKINGRAVKNADGSVTLSASASSCIFNFEGSECILYLKNIAYPGDYNYINLEIDGEYTGRRKVDGGEVQSIAVKAENNNTIHKLVVSKATEASNGLVVITKIEGENITKDNSGFSKKIEFIGNSITCGYGNDLEIPCGGNSKWYDQHNAYWSYASIVARELNVEYMISAISGAGIYRNWDTDGPTMPQQYGNTFLNTDTASKWDFKRFVPDIVTIALGTNDMSDGDGSPRLPFDINKFIADYKIFISRVYSHYPNTQIVLLNSPMVHGENGKLLEECLTIIEDDVNKNSKPLRPIQHFFFAPMNPRGCGHPSIEDDKIMAAGLVPAIKKIMNW